MKDLPISEITLRKYEKPSTQDARELARKLCLSLGLLQPGDGRDIIVDILMVLMEARRQGKVLSLGEVQEQSIALRTKYNLELRGVAGSNMRRQIKKLRDLLIVEKFKNSYRLSEFSTLEKIFSDKIEKFYLATIVERIKEYLNELDK
ncbi:MAG TPA: hypothetical protein HA282_02320 [Nanoarchaeota archaeon]|nr:MAG: hypothetical protein QT01_C0004G0042 [archaeon GW2011_AR6]HIH33678.1 hypothetical protein [Nanoarchaeota archaeon]HIH51464.1 hypothetical protein [Nanoarchaeota archaeon]HIH66028.1 hypothetical protein [Nanoarchaeota archaeon]